MTSPGSPAAAKLLGLHAAWPSAYARLRALLDAVTRVYAGALFSRRRDVGALVMIALAVVPRCLVLSLCALFGSELCLRGLRLVRGYIPYGYNALLCGSALGASYALSPGAAVGAVVLGALCVLVTAGCAAIAASLGYLPIAAIPFTLTMWGAYGLAPYLDLSLAWTTTDPWAEHLPPTAALYLQGLGSTLLVPHVAAGAVLFLSLLLHSRVSSLIVAVALALVVYGLTFAAEPLTDAVIQTTAANGVLAALALGGVWLVPSRQTTWLSLSGALLAAFFTLGSVGPLYLLGLWPGFLPAGAVLIVVMSALRQREVQKAPLVAQTVADNPEQLLLDHMARPRQHVTGLLVTPPFHGMWTCTQGANGPFTHRGTLAHAYDFEVYDDATGSLCRTTGEAPEDYHCFAQPIYAVADGTVVAIESSVPNNALGEVDSQRPWGNYVVVQHGPSVYSLLAHLSPGTVTVYPGQFVARASIVGYCGSSGRSPRPHLHFQLQAGPAVGATTIPCELQDVVVRTGEQLRFEPLHEAQHGESIRALTPDYALAALFDVPLGARLTYRMGNRVESIVCELDSWGRVQLRSLDLDARLILVRTAACLRSAELHGSAHSVLRLWRLALATVAFERAPSLKAHSKIPRRWIASAGRGLSWDVSALVLSPGAITVESELEVVAQGMSVVSRSRERSKLGEPLLQASACFEHATSANLPGPSWLEVTTHLGTRRVWRAERVVETPETRSIVAEHAHRAPPGFALELGDWS